MTPPLHGATAPERRPLRICMLAACPFPANHGTPGSIREMAEALAAAGHDVHVVTYHFGDAIPVRRVHIHRIPALTRETGVAVGPTIRRPLYDLQMILTTLRVVRRYKPDVMHAHGYEAALVAAACRLFARVPVVYSAHNTMRDELASYGVIRPHFAAAALAHVLDAIVPRLADRCLPHSANLARFLEGRASPGRIDQVVNFGIDVEWMGLGDPSGLRERYRLGSGPVLLYTGVLDRFQRLDLLIEAVALAARRVPALTLLVVTTLRQTHHLATLRALAAQHLVTERVVITEPQPLESVRDFLQIADLAVVPRPAAAGFPIKLLNYMAARRPAVLFASSASVGIVNRSNAILAQTDTADALSAAIVELLENHELRRTIAQGGFDFVRAYHDRAAVATHVSQCYARVLRRSPEKENECHAFSS